MRPEKTIKAKRKKRIDKISRAKTLERFSRPQQATVASERLCRNIDSCNVAEWKNGSARRATVGPDLRAGRRHFSSRNTAARGFASPEFHPKRCFLCMIDSQ